MNSTILQQVFVVEFVVQSQMCDACHRRAAQDYWKATVQVRQKVCYHHEPLASSSKSYQAV
jgi:nonsense-mediated mRNA decay protein 3